MILVWAFHFLFLSATAADYYPHEIRNVETDHHGYGEAWVRVQSPTATKDSHESPLELTVPFCNSQSVKHVDQLCATPDGTLLRVSEIRGSKIRAEPVDLSTEQSYNAFAAKTRMTSTSRMPASVQAYPEVTCEASCPQMMDSNACRATGMTKEKAYKELQSVVVEKANAECKLCNLKAVVCGGQVYRTALSETKVEPAEKPELAP